MAGRLKVVGCWMSERWAVAKVAAGVVEGVRAPCCCVRWLSSRLPRNTSSCYAPVPRTHLNPHHPCPTHRSTTCFSAGATAGGGAS